MNVLGAFSFVKHVAVIFFLAILCHAKYGIERGSLGLTEEAEQTAKAVVRPLLGHTGDPGPS